MAKPLPQLQSQKRCSVARSAGPPSRRELSVATVLKVGLSLYGLRTSCPRRHPATAADVRAPRGAVLGHAARPKGPRKILERPIDLAVASGTWRLTWPSRRAWWLIWTGAYPKSAPALPRRDRPDSLKRHWQRIAIKRRKLTRGAAKKEAYWKLENLQAVQLKSPGPGRRGFFLRYRPCMLTTRYRGPPMTSPAPPRLTGAC
jgi:hypothetical protein